MKKIIEYFSKSTPKTFTLLFMVLGIALLSLPTSHSSTNPQRIAEESALDSEEQNFLDILNEHRAELELSELKIVPILNEAAQWMAEDLKESGNQSHTDSEGRNPQERLEDFGYNHDGGENIAFTSATGEKAFQDWLASQIHKENMEHPDWKAVGISRVQKNNNGWIWVTNFGDTVSTQDEEGNNENNEEETSQESSCGPEDLSDSGEFDNACYDTQKCATDEQKGAWCKCRNDGECASKKCSIPDGFDRKYCEKMPEPTEAEDENEENQGPPQEVTVNLTVAVPGVGINTALGQNNNPLRKTRGLLFQFIDENDEVINEAQGLLTYGNGAYTGTITTELPVGNYTLRIATDNSLYLTIPRVIGVSEDENSYTIPKVSLVTGNISQTDSSKNTLDIFDYNALLSCYGGKSCNNPQLSDLNEDGKVDSLDFNILLRNFAIQ